MSKIEGNAFPAIPDLFKFTGYMDDLICPCCSLAKVWMFKSIDREELQLRCDNCSFEMRYERKDTLRSFWKSLSMSKEVTQLPTPWQTFVKDISPDIHDAEGQNDIMMHFCEQGWELVNVQGRYAYFKRVNPEWIAWQEMNERKLRRLSRRA